MYKIKDAENNDVDLLLDMKLDIIFNSEEIVNLDRNEMEKLVNYSEEEIRDNLQHYKLVFYDNNLVAMFAVIDYEDGKLIDTIYVKQDYRNKGIGTKILNKIIQTNYQALYLWVYKSNKNAIDLYNKMNFLKIEETETRFLMKNENIKDENNLIKAKLFCKEVEELYKKYKLEYFFITESMTSSQVGNNKLIQGIYNNCNTANNILTENFDDNL